MTWKMSEVRQGLIALLAHTRAEITHVLERLEDDEIDAAQLVPHLESLRRLDGEREVLLDQLRHQASIERRRDEERSIRQFILQALDEVHAPQTAGFLEDYVYVRERVMLNSRNFGALRRDENRSWMRPRSRRRAYIVPCLDEQGEPVPRWMARSDWPLTDRIFIPGVEALWGWMRVVALGAALRQEQDETVKALYPPLVEKYAAEALGEQPGSTEEMPIDWEAAERQARTAVDQLEAQFAAPRAAIASRFDKLEPGQQLWGVSSIGSPGDRGRHAQ
jgi:hypothetical protein